MLDDDIGVVYMERLSRELSNPTTTRIGGIVKVCGQVVTIDTFAISHSVRPSQPRYYTHSSFTKVDLAM